eukprot:scaffold11660_cov51-Prasinocladus_malaysianus.AAC.2
MQVRRIVALGASTLTEDGKLKGAFYTRTSASDIDSNSTSTGRGPASSRPICGFGIPSLKRYRRLATVLI